MPTYESLPAQSKFFKGNLFQKMADDLRLAGKAKRTVYGYLRAVRNLADFCETFPDRIDEPDLRDYLLHLIVERQAATGTQTVALSGIKFFFATLADATGKFLLKPSCDTSVRSRKSSRARKFSRSSTPAERSA